MKAIENFIEKLIFASRWFQVPLYLGLVAVLVILSIKFLLELVHLFTHIWSMDESNVVLAVLTLVDVVMVANLIVMVVISGYENFVSRIELGEAEDKLSWFGKLDAGSLKIKLASSIVAISSIHLLKAFLDVNDIANDKVLLLIAIHMTFIASALLLAYLDRMVGHKTGGGDGH
jgi:uncharacterized protein (TIGR00645 family)